MTLRRNRFKQPFQPLGMKKRRTFLISVPGEHANIMTTLSLLGGLQKWGQIILLVPQATSLFYCWLPDKHYKKIIYTKPARTFGKELGTLRQQLQGNKINFLIELNTPANISLPCLTSIEKRICFYDMKNYPYFNIMMKDGFTSLHEFFTIKKSDPGKVLRFTGRTQSQVRTAYGKRKPLCFVNGNAPAQWDGDMLILDKDIPATHHDVLCLLNCADAYYGHRDIFHDFACVFKKTILDQ